MTPTKTTTLSLLAIASLALGCGGGKQADTTPASGGTERAEAPAAGGEMVPPEKIDEIKRSLERKRPVMSRCLAMAVDNKELPRNAAGKVTVEIVIAPSGAAESVKIVRATLESKMLSDCVISRVKEIPFPQLPRSFETSFTYGFEAM
jgi:hypothetical protein